MNYEIELNINAYTDEELKNILNVKNNDFNELDQRVSIILNKINENKILTNRKKRKLITFINEIKEHLTILFLKVNCQSMNAKIDNIVDMINNLKQ